MILNPFEVEKYILATAKRAGIRVIWENKTEPRTDGNNMYLPKINSGTTQEQADMLMSMIVHEVAHNLHSDFNVINEKNADATKSLLGYIFNSIEDDNVDFLNSMEYEGDRQIRSRTHEQIVGDVCDKVEQRLKKEKLNEETERILAVLAFNCETVDDFLNGLGTYPDRFRNMIKDKKILGQFDKLFAGDYHEEVRKLREDTSLNRTRKAYALSRRIYEEVFELDADKEEERMKKLREQEAKRRGSSKKGAKDDGEGDASKARMGEGKDGDSEIEEVEYEEFMTEPMQPFHVRETISRGHHVDYTKYDAKGGSGAYTPTTQAETIVFDYVKGTANQGYSITDLSHTSRYHDYHSDTYGKVLENVNDGFAQKVKMLLQIRSKGKVQYGTKRGNLHAGNVYRVVLKNAPGYNERVFKRRIVSDVLDSCVQILVDISGSMGGHKLYHAMIGAVHLSETLGNIIKVPCEIIGFTELQSKNAMFVWRDFDTQLLSKEKLLDRMIHSSHYTEQNADGEAVLFGYQRIIQRSEKRKLMIVLSDGSPAASRSGDINNYTKKVVEHIQKSRHVEIVGIGIMDNNVKRFYKENYVINSAEEIETALLKLIDKKIV